MSNHKPSTPASSTAASEAGEELQEQPAISLQPKRIAVIDDSSPFRMLLKQMLEACKYKVDVYGYGEDLLQGKESTGVYDLIICDVYMPGINGMNVVETIRMRPESRQTPILLVTGEPSLEILAMSRKYMVNDFISKPIDANQFMLRVKKLLFPPVKKANV